MVFLCLGYSPKFEGKEDTHRRFRNFFIKTNFESYHNFRALGVSNPPKNHSFVY